MLRPFFITVSLTGLLWISGSESAAVASEEPEADDRCDGSGEYSYICGPASAEDLVLVPGTKWVVASGFGGSMSLYLVDSERKTWRDFYPAGEPRARQNMATYGSCPLLFWLSFAVHAGQRSCEFTGSQIL